MNVLAFDPGAERCGYAYLEEGPVYIASGLVGLHRGTMDFQEYRLALEAHTYKALVNLINTYTPDLIVNEIVPPIGSGNFVGPQSYLANIVATIIHVVAWERGTEVRQISARTMQKRVAIYQPGQKISKVNIRNGVIEHFPECRPQFMAMKPDETDAIAIALCFM